MNMGVNRVFKRLVFNIPSIILLFSHFLFHSVSHVNLLIRFANKKKQSRLV